MQHNYYAEDDKCIIAPLQEQDIEHLRQWRNDKSLSKFLRPVPYITSEAEKRWFEEYLKESGTYFFVVIDKSTNRVIGSVALYDVDGLTCDVGKIVIGDPSAHGKGLGYRSVFLAICVGIQKFHIQKFHLDVHTENIAALSIYIKAGFEVCGSHDFMKGGKEIEMVLNQDRFKVCNPTYKDVIAKGTEFSELGETVRKLKAGIKFNKLNYCILKSA